MAELDDDVLAPEVQPILDSRKSDVIGARIADDDHRWKPGVTLAIGDVRWAPSHVVPDKKWALHVHLSEGIPRHVERRLRAAADAGYTVHVALPIDALYDAEVLAVLSDIDAYTYVVDDPVAPLTRRHFLAAMADLGVAVEAPVRSQLARAAWERRSEGTANERGRRLEALLAFLLGQVTDFRVFDRNFRTETQEIDIVLQLDNVSNRCWSTLGVPFILVEAKNTAESAGQPVISLLVRKLQTKRRTTRLGLLFCVSGFTADAEKEELRLSESEYCVAMFNGDHIVALIDAEDLDECLEQHVAKAMLR